MNLFPQKIRKQQLLQLVYVHTHRHYLCFWRILTRKSGRVRRQSEVELNRKYSNLCLWGERGSLCSNVKPEQMCKCHYKTSNRNTPASYQPSSVTDCTTIAGDMSPQSSRTRFHVWKNCANNGSTARVSTSVDWPPLKYSTSVHQESTQSDILKNGRDSFLQRCD